MKKYQKEFIDMKLMFDQTLIPYEQFKENAPISFDIVSKLVGKFGYYTDFMYFTTHNPKMYQTVLWTKNNHYSILTEETSEECRNGYMSATGSDNESKAGNDLADGYLSHSTLLEIACDIIAFETESCGE
jgi:hypothetical protein